LVRGRDFSALLQKVKIKIQNDVIVHQSASQSVNEDVRINFKQSNQCFNALKCQKCAIKIKNQSSKNNRQQTVAARRRQKSNFCTKIALQNVRRSPNICHSSKGQVPKFVFSSPRHFKWSCSPSKIVAQTRSLLHASSQSPSKFVSKTLKTVPARRRQKAVETHQKPSKGSKRSPSKAVTSKLVKSFKLQVSWSLE